LSNLFHVLLFQSELGGPHGVVHAHRRFPGAPKDVCSSYPAVPLHIGVIPSPLVLSTAASASGTTIPAFQGKFLFLPL